MTTTPPLLSGLDGLMSLSRREGVDIRPTLLRVLTDIYVQSPTHTGDEEQQFVELASRLIEQVDDATRAAVRARLAIYARTPSTIADQLEIRAPNRQAPTPPAVAEPERAIEPVAATNTPPIAPLPMLPNDTAQVSAMFFAADSGQRVSILFHLDEMPLKAATPVSVARAEHAIEVLELAAFASDVETFTRELADALILPARIAAQVVDDGGGEPLACALKALGMSSTAYQRVLLFLKPEVGASVSMVYRLSRLYDRISERAALILLAAWRGAATPASRGKYQPLLHDDERHRARAHASQPRVESQQKNSDTAARTSLRRESDG